MNSVIRNIEEENPQDIIFSFKISYKALQQSFILYDQKNFLSMNC